MKYILSSLITLGIFVSTGCSQNKPGETPNKRDSKKDVVVGSACEGCEAIYECPVPFDELKSTCHLPDWNEKGPKLAVNGTVYRYNGVTPASGVIIYIYHTDQAGVYSKKGGETGWGKRHGYIRGWMKTNEKGEYKFFTLKPASYPNSKSPAHIHVIIKEEGKIPYWIDEYFFDDDPYLTEKERKNTNPRGGIGIIKTKDVGNMLKSQRNIILGMNIPGYPVN